MDNVIKKCGYCAYFTKLDGIFGNCKAKHRENYDEVAFFTNDACGSFVPKKIEKNEQKATRFNDQSGLPPHMAMFGPLPLISMMFGMRPPGSKVPMNNEKKETDGWINPIVKRHPGRRIIPFKEAAEALLKKKKSIGRTGL